MDPRDIRLRFENPVLEDEPWDIRMRLDVVQVQTPIGEWRFIVLSKYLVKHKILPEGCNKLQLN